MLSAIRVIPSRFVVSQSIVGHLPPPYGTRRGALLSDFWWSMSRSPGMPNAHVSRRWHGCDGAGAMLPASAFGTDNNAWNEIKSRQVRRPFRAIALACCQMLIGVFATVSMLSIMRADSAVWHPMAWFGAHDSARSEHLPSMAIHSAPMQSASQVVDNVPASMEARRLPTVGVARPAPAVPKMSATKPVGRGTRVMSTPMERDIARRSHSIRPRSVASKNGKPAPMKPARQRTTMHVIKHRPPSSVKRMPAYHDRANDDAIRALRNELVREDAAARTRAAVSAHVPADAVFLLRDQVRLTER